MVQSTPGTTAECVAKDFLQDNPCAILFGKNVTKIQYEETGDLGVTVTTSDSSMFQAKTAILTFSAGVVNQAVADNSLFEPSLITV